MLVGETQRVADPGGVRRRRSLRQGQQHHVQPMPAAPLPAAPNVGNPSIASGPWPADLVRARADAQRVLNSIDWSKRDLVLWVPGTSGHDVDPRFADAVHASWAEGNVSLTHLVYPATWDLRPSVATGLATLQLVLAGIAAHQGDHRVMLAGESQGAWIIGEAVADPMLRKVVDRAVLFGHPSLAKTHWSDGRDSQILEINDPKDHVPMPTQGDPAGVLDAMVAISTGQLWKVGSIAGAIAGNLQLMPTYIRNIASQIPGVGRFLRNPHDYGSQFSSAVEFLRFGTTSYGRPAPGAEPSSTAPPEQTQEPTQPARRRASRRRRVSPAA